MATDNLPDELTDEEMSTLESQGASGAPSDLPDELTDAEMTALEGGVSGPSAGRFEGLTEVDTSATKPIKQRTPKTTGWQAAGRASAQGATIGTGDEIAGAVDALMELGQRRRNQLSDGNLIPSFSEEIDAAGRTYRATRDRERALNRDAAEDHPVIYGTTQVLSSIPAAIASGGVSAAAPFLVGAGQGVAHSEAGLTPEEISPENLREAASSAVLGGTINRAATAFPNASRVALPALGAGAAIAGDKIGMSDADRVAAATGTALALPGLASSAAKKVGDTFGKKAAPAIAQLTDDLTALDVKDDLKAQKTFERDRAKTIRSVRKEEDATFRADQKVNKKEAALENLDTKEEAILLKQAAKREKDANQKYLKQIGVWDDELKALDTVRAKRGAGLAKLEKALAEVAQQRKDLDASTSGHRAASWKELYTRLDQYERITGESLPEKYGPLRAKAAQMYKKTSEDVIKDPDEAAAAYRAMKELDLDRAEEAAKKTIDDYKAAPFDEEQAVRDALKKRGYRVSKNEAFALAQKLGLDVGDFESFQPVPPKGGWRLIDGGPDRPVPDALETQLTNIESKRSALNKPAPVPERRPEEDILAGTGLETFTPPTASRPPVSQRVENVVDQATKDATAKVLANAGKGAFTGLGGAFGANALGISGVPASIAVPVGGALGARHAIRTLTALEVDPVSGKTIFKDPAAAAGVYRALEKIFSTVPNLGAKYARGWQAGLSPVQTAFFIRNDPELAEALSRELNATQP